MASRQRASSLNAKTEFPDTQNAPTDTAPNWGVPAGVFLYSPLLAPELKRATPMLLTGKLGLEAP